MSVELFQIAHLFVGFGGCTQQCSGMLLAGLQSTFMLLGLSPGEVHAGQVHYLLKLSRPPFPNALFSLVTSDEEHGLGRLLNDDTPSFHPRAPKQQATPVVPKTKSNQHKQT